MAERASDSLFQYSQIVPRRIFPHKYGIYGAAVGYEQFVCHFLNPTSCQETVHVMDNNDTTQNNRLKRLIHNAEFAQLSASITDSVYTSGRKLNKTFTKRLAGCEYIIDYRNIFIIGATSSGKSYMAGLCPRHGSLQVLLQYKVCKASVFSLTYKQSLMNGC